MTPAAIIRKAQAEGVSLALSPAGTIKAVGTGEAVNRWLPIIREHKAELLNELQAGSADIAELRDLVRRVGTHYGFTPDEHTLALDIALADPVGALTCFRTIAEERGLGSDALTRTSYSSKPTMRIPK